MISRAVVADMSGAWEPYWAAALERQEQHPEVLAVALQAPEDFAEAAEQMVPQFALMHPTILRTAIAHCRAVVAELAEDPVTPLGHTPERVFVSVEGGRMGEWGGQQQHDRLAELERENHELRRQLEIEVAGRQTDRETLRAIATLAGLRLDGIG
jgi:hypothetical protein